MINVVIGLCQCLIGAGDLPWFSFVCMFLGVLLLFRGCCFAVGAFVFFVWFISLDCARM